jgi:sirohydrochlorin ferrochelatase
VKKAVLLVDHGSRREEANAQLDALAALVRVRLPDHVIAAAHLEIASPSVAEGIDACVAEGAAQIVIHPFFLAPGRHSTQDLPRLAREGSERHPGVSIHVGSPLGLHPLVVEAVIERIAEALSRGSGGAWS